MRLVHDFSSARNRTYRHPSTQGFRTQRDIASHPMMLARIHLACSPHSTLYLVKDQYDAVLFTYLLNSFEIPRWWHYESTLSDYRLYNNCGHAICSYGANKIIFEVFSTCQSARWVTQVKGTTIAIWSRNTIHLRRKRAKLIFVRHYFTGEAHGHHSPSMERIIQGNDGRSFGPVSCNFYPIFYCLGPAVCKHGHLVKITGGNLIEFLCQLYVRLIHDHMKACMNIRVRLVLDSTNNRIGTMSDILHANAASKIDILFTVYIHQHCPVCSLNEQGRNVEHPFRDIGSSSLK